MRIRRQPFSGLVEFTPGAHTLRVRHEEVDGTVKLVCPFPAMRDGAPLRIDKDECSRPNHGFHCLISEPDDAAPVMAWHVVLSGKQRCLIGNRTGGGAVWKPAPRMLFEWAACQQERRIRTGDLVKVLWLSASLRPECKQLVGGDAVDRPKHDQFLAGDSPAFLFNPEQPTCGDLVGGLAPFLSKTCGSLFHLP